MAETRYRRVKIENGKTSEPVQYVGVHVLRWRPEWGEPQVAFTELDDDAEDTDAQA